MFIYIHVVLNCLHLVGAQLCRLSPVNAHTVAVKPDMEK